MLCLTRKRGESVKCGDSLVVTVINIKGGIVKLGFQAPRELLIKRAELGPKKEAGETT